MRTAALKGEGNTRDLLWQRLAHVIGIVRLRHNGPREIAPISQTAERQSPRLTSPTGFRQHLPLLQAEQTAMSNSIG